MARSLFIPVLVLMLVLPAYGASLDQKSLRTNLESYGAFPECPDMKSWLAKAADPTTLGDISRLGEYCPAPKLEAVLGAVSASTGAGNPVYVPTQTVIFSSAHPAFSGSVLQPAQVYYRTAVESFFRPQAPIMELQNFDLHGLFR